LSVVVKGRQDRSLKLGSLLFGMGGLESEKLYVSVPSVVNRYALNQPQRRRGTKGHILCLNSPTLFSEEPEIILPFQAELLRP